jgi:hypothetical protein
MRRKFRNKQKTKLRISLRTLLFAGAALSVAVVIVSVMVVSFFKNEESSAEVNPMVVTGISVEQDTTSVYSGMRDVPVLKIKVNTRGTGNRLSLTDITFSARGTSQPLQEAIVTARLWYTAGEDIFAMSRQFGSTIDQINEPNLRFSAKQLLQEGVNYFWLAYDTGTPDENDVKIDAELIRATIGTLVMEPDLSAPAGSILLKKNSPWYSTGSSDISSLESWNSHRDGSGVRPTNFSRSSSTFHIQSGHTMQNKLNACIPSVIIERNGTLINETTVSTDMLLVSQGGTFIHQSKNSDINKLRKLKIVNGGKYVHDTKQPIPSQHTIFDQQSSATFLQMPEAVYYSEMFLGNVTVVCSNTQMTFPFSNLQGDLELRGNSPENTVVLNSEKDIHINGDLVVNNSGLILASKGSSQNIHIGNKLYIKSGTVNDGGGNAVIKLGDAFTMKSGSLILKNPGSLIAITKPNTVWHQSGECLLPDVIIYPGATLKLKTERLGDIGANRNFKVSGGATFDSEQGFVSGQGKFEIEPGAMLITSHRYGIGNEQNKGCIQTSKKIMSSDASYQFTGADSPQYTGVFETSPDKNTVRDFIINKADITGVVILENDIKYSGEFIRKKGSLNKNGHTFEFYRKTQSETPTAKL